MTGTTAGHTPPVREEARRLFFALWPDEEARRGLADAVRRHVPEGLGKPQRPDQWHLTLQFLGDVPESRLPAVLDAGSGASASAAIGELTFDRLQYWKRPQVLCMVASTVPKPIAALVESLRSQLALRRFAPEPRPFKAHVTLARKLRRGPADAAVTALHWPVRELSLVQSLTERQGSRYVQLAAWPLAA